MLYVGSDDGAYRLGNVLDADRETTSERALDSGAVMRLRQLHGVDGLFAATASGLHYTPEPHDGIDGGDAEDTWMDLGVPSDAVYAVGASSDGETLYAGTRPAAIYAGDVPGTGSVDANALEWRECEGFQDLPSREDWRLPRHEDVAHVRDVKGLPGDADSVVAAVEVGGVHASADRGATWVERRGDVQPGALEGVDRSDDWSQRPGDVHDDVHELAVVDDGEYLAATGFGLYRTTDAGASWTRLDDDVDQRYFRTAFATTNGTAYVAGALSSAGNWDDPDENPGFFEYTPADGLQAIAVPTPDEVVTGATTAPDGTVLAGTHRGTLLRQSLSTDRDTEEWSVAGTFPTGPDTTGTYTPLTWIAN